MATKHTDKIHDEPGYGETGEKAKSQARSMLAERKGEASEKLGGLASALKETAQHLHQEKRDESIADYLERAAEKIDQLTNYINNRDIDQLVDSIKEKAKERPGIFLAGSFALGFLFARFLKNRPAESYQI